MKLFMLSTGYMEKQHESSMKALHNLVNETNINFESIHDFVCS
jgi:hypothetical protein